MATETKSQTWWGGYALGAEESSVAETKKYLEFSISFPRDATLYDSAPTQSGSKQGSTSLSKTHVIPSMANIKQHLKVLPNTSLFYSRIAKGAPSYKLVAKAWRDNHNPSLYVLEESWDPTQSWTQFYGYTGGASVFEKDIFWARACKALAELASGRVFVVLGPGIIAPDWGDFDTAWAKYEWPALQVNNAVKEVVQVNPCTGSTTVILAR
jgi:hypothetical protein